MKTLYHERQEEMLSRLSGLHCLNNICQSQVFRRGDLTLVANELYREESRNVIGVEYNGKIHCYHDDEKGFDKKEDQFVGVEYHNMTCCSHHHHHVKEDSISIQVLTRLLQIVHYDLVNLRTSNDSRAVEARLSTADHNGYICNSGGHWHAILKFQKRWYSLDSRLPRPLELTVVGPHISLFLSKDLHFTTEKFDEVFIVLVSRDKY